MSHFTTVQTKINDVVCLKRALHDLGFTFTEAKAGEKVHVRGYQRQKTEADLAIHVSKSYDVGVIVTAQGVRFVADWWGVETTRGLTEQEFVQLVLRKYSAHKVKEELKKRGYTIALEEEKEDQTLHIKVRRY